MILPTSAPELMSPALRQAAEEYAKANPDLLDPDGAHDTCFDTCAVFAGFLDGRGIIVGEEPGDDWDTIRVREVGTGSAPVDFRKYKCHWVFRVGLVALDFTARQFHPEAPVPVVWKLSQADLDYEARMMRRSA
jgi:hypothetical protein